MRNSNLTAIAPTATISNILGVSPSIEPCFSNIYTRTTLSGDNLVVNKYLVRELKKLGLWTEAIVAKIKKDKGSVQGITAIPKKVREVFRTAFEVSPLALNRLNAIRQRYIDQAISYNVYYAGTDGEELSNIYIDAWKQGIKSTYYLRSLGEEKSEGTEEINCIDCE